MVKIDANPPDQRDRGSSPADLPPSDQDHDSDDDGRGGGDSGRWVTVAAFSLPQQAHLARLRLESEDIDCFLIDENLVATDWLLANAVGGIKVKVHEADAQEARAILGTRAVLADDVEDADAEADDDLSQHIECPSCGSADVERTWFSRRLFFLGFLIGLPLPVPMRIWRCIRCHHEWKHQPGFPISDGKSGEG